MQLTCNKNGISFRFRTFILLVYQNFGYLNYCSPFCKIEFNAKNIIDRFRLIYQVSYPDPKLHYDYKTNNLCRLILPKFVCIVSISVMCAK